MESSASYGVRNVLDGAVCRRRALASIAPLVVVCQLAGVTCVALLPQAAAQERSRSADRPAESGPPRDFSSAHFFVHTDLPAEEANELLKRLETMLGLISEYWGRRPSGIIECYVVRDLKNWPADSLHPIGRAKIEQDAGVTLSVTATDGKRFRAKAVVYAIADHGTPQHEAVHAYCAQTFGTTGPTWYSEGMAEMGQYWVKDERAVNADLVVVRYLRESPPRSLLEIVDPADVPGGWQDYAWRWALCHLLANNSNYSSRFRPLGLGMLTQQPVSFEKVYDAMADEISFEYLFFLKHVDRGYRVDLCEWDWKKRFRGLTSRAISARVVANRGWQGTSAKLSAGEQYQYSATGAWKLGKDEEAVDADGSGDGRGRLVGVLMNEFELGEPFDLGSQGEFTAENDGNLYVRCNDEWNALADNDGRMVVKLKRTSKSSANSKATGR